jgi:hypothetical protein
MQSHSLEDPASVAFQENFKQQFGVPIFPVHVTADGEYTYTFSLKEQDRGHTLSSKIEDDAVIITLNGEVSRCTTYTWWGPIEDFFRKHTG